MNILHPASFFRRLLPKAIARVSITVACVTALAANAAEQPPAGGVGQPQVTGTNNGSTSGVTLDGSTLKSYGFSAGIAGIVMNRAGVENATVDAGGIIRVEETSTARAGGVFEAHYFLTDVRKKPATKEAAIGVARLQGGVEKEVVVEGTVVSDVAHGMTFVVELGQNVVRSVGFGYLVSFRDLKRDKTGNTVSYSTIGNAFNLGLVALVEPNVKVLGAGLQKNTKLPAGDAIRFDHEPHFGGALMFSWSF